MLKSNKGITLIKVVIALLILIIITGVGFGFYKIGVGNGKEEAQTMDESNVVDNSYNDNTVVSNTSTEQQVVFPKEISLSKTEKDNLMNTLINKFDNGFYFSKSLLTGEDESIVYKNMKTLNEEDMLIFALLLHDGNENTVKINKNDNFIGIYDDEIKQSEGEFETVDSVSAKIEKYFGKKSINYTSLDLDKLMVNGAIYNVTKKAFRPYTEYGGASHEYRFVKLEQIDENNNYALYVDMYIEGTEGQDLGKDRTEKFLLKKLTEGTGSRYVIEGRQII